EKCGTGFGGACEDGERASSGKTAVIPPDRTHYLGLIANSVEDYKTWAVEQCAAARKLYQLQGARQTLAEAGSSLDDIDTEIAKVKLDDACRKLLDGWPEFRESYQQDVFKFQVRDKTIEIPLASTTLSGLEIPKISLPNFEDWGEILRFLLLENTAGFFPYTAGIYPFKRQMEDPKRMFAGEGPPERTNKRFHLLCKGEPAKRLSTAFDSATLYGQDPDDRPDIFGKIGESGVSICTLDDIKKLYAGFDLCAPNTSVSMTINGPAPMMLAMFLNAAIQQQIDKFVEDNKRPPDKKESAKIKTNTLHVVRGTVQADILKEDQAQNTCIFSTEFALRMMGDIQEYFIANKVRNYYSVSISGYHIAEAGANPISQLAFTMSNGFTLVEYYLSRGMKIDDFAPNLSFFFSNGMDAEYSVIGRVARRIWSIAMRDLYGANERSQKLKYHIQTSGRSLHAQEIQFNDIRTTLQALLALYDNCNSLHTNAFDEAITTPTEESVRRAMAIQLIIGKEFGVAKNENSLQGSYLFEELTDLVEEAVLNEFRRISNRGGVLGAMETQYQRNKIQEESLHYEHLKHSGELPIIGVNCYENPASLAEDFRPAEPELRRATPEEKQHQLDNLRAFQKKHAKHTATALTKLQEVATANGNIFEEMMNTVKVASIGQISHALYEVGGQYRRNM
ncbi:methylmalonyl-CoA mutase family protein, partial [Planctomycetota bacterium]